MSKGRSGVGAESGTGLRSSLLTSEVSPTLTFSAEVSGVAEVQRPVLWKVRVWNLIPLISFRAFVFPACGRESGAVWSGCGQAGE